MSYQLPSLVSLKKSAAELLVDYRKEQQEKLQSQWLYAPFGYSGSRIDDITFIQVIMANLEQYEAKSKHKHIVSRFDLMQAFNHNQQVRVGNAKGYQHLILKNDSFTNREQKAIEHGKQCMMAGIFFFFLESIDSGRSALYTSCKKALGLDEQSVDLHTVIQCYSELHTFLSGDYLKGLTDANEKTRKSIDKQIFSRLTELTSQQESLGNGLSYA
jgi:hypothetical protein